MAKARGKTMTSKKSKKTKSSANGTSTRGSKTVKGVPLPEQLRAKGFISTGEAAEKYGVTRTAVVAAVHRGSIEGVWSGKRIFVSIESAEEYYGVKPVPVVEE